MKSTGFNFRTPKQEHLALMETVRNFGSVATAQKPAILHSYHSVIDSTYNRVWYAGSGLGMNWACYTLSVRSQEPCVLERTNSNLQLSEDFYLYVYRLLIIRI